MGQVVLYLPGATVRISHLIFGEMAKFKNLSRLFCGSAYVWCWGRGEGEEKKSRMIAFTVLCNNRLIEKQLIYHRESEAGVGVVGGIIIGIRIR